MANAVTGVLFIEFPKLHIHLDPFIDSVHIFGSFHFWLYFFFRCDFVVLLMHPLLDPATLYITIPLYMAHPFPPPLTTAAPAPVVLVAAAPATASLASPP